MEKIDVMIAFTDGAVSVIEGATDYFFNQKEKRSYVVKNGYRIFLNTECVKCIGRNFDISNS